MGYIQNPGKLVGPFMGRWWQFGSIIDYGTGNFTRHQQSSPLISEMVERLCLLDESEQTPPAVGLNVLLDEEDKAVLRWFHASVLPGAREKKSPAKTSQRAASHFNAFESG